MCGINGMVMLKGVERSEEMMKMIRFVFNELMVETQDRGEHATGIAHFGRDGSWEYYKNANNADMMTTHDDEYNSIINNLHAEESSIIIGHTRYKTKGDQKNNNNNHPFHVGDVIGIHNGSVKNDDDLFKEYGFDRVGEVDSEIVFQLINYYNRKDISLAGLKSALIDTKLKGVFALSFVHLNNTNLLHLIKQDRPMELAYWKEAGIVIFNSVADYVKKAFRKLDRALNVLGIEERPTVTYKRVTADRYFTVNAEASTYEEAVSDETRFYIETTQYYTTTYNSNYNYNATTLRNQLESTTTSLTTTDSRTGIKLYGEVDDVSGKVKLTQAVDETIEDEKEYEEVVVDFSEHTEDDGSGLLPGIREEVEYCADCGQTLFDYEQKSMHNQDNPYGDRYCSTCYNETARI